MNEQDWRDFEEAAIATRELHSDHQARRLTDPVAREVGLAMVEQRRYFACPRGGRRARRRRRRRERGLAWWAKHGGGA